MHLLKVSPPQVFQALSDATRLRVIRLLFGTNQEACLCELVDSLQEPQYKLSRHLKILRQAGFLDIRKEGRWVYHRLVTQPSYLKTLVKAVGELPDEDNVLRTDTARFKERLKHRTGGRCRVGILTEELQSEAG